MSLFFMPIKRTVKRTLLTLLLRNYFIKGGSVSVNNENDDDKRDGEMCNLRKSTDCFEEYVNHGTDIITSKFIHN